MSTRPSLSSNSSPIKLNVCITFVNAYFYEIEIDKSNDKIDKLKKKIITLLDKIKSLTTDIEAIKKEINTNSIISFVKYGSEYIIDDSIKRNVNTTIDTLESGDYLFVRQFQSYSGASGLYRLSYYVESNYTNNLSASNNFTKLNSNPYDYNFYRPARGDGNCYFYAYFCSVLERIANNTNNTNNFDNSKNNFINNFALTGDIENIFNQGAEISALNITDNEGAYIKTNLDFKNFVQYIKTIIESKFDSINIELNNNNIFNNSTSNFSTNNHLKPKAFMHLFYSSLNANPEFAYAIQMMLRLWSVVLVNEYINEINTNANTNKYNKIKATSESDINSLIVDSNINNSNNKTKINELIKLLQDNITQCYEKLLKNNENCLNIVPKLFDLHFFENNDNLQLNYILLHDYSNINRNADNNMSVVQPINVGSHYDIIYKSNSKAYLLNNAVLKLFKHSNSTATQKSFDTAKINLETAETKNTELKNKVDKFYNNNDYDKLPNVINDIKNIDKTCFEESFIVELINKYKNKINPIDQNAYPICNLILSGIKQNEYNGLQLLSNNLQLFPNNFTSDDFEKFVDKNLINNLSTDDYIIGLSIYRTGLSLFDFMNSDYFENVSTPLSIEEVKNKLLQYFNKKSLTNSTSVTPQIYYATFKIDDDMNVVDFKVFNNENDSSYTSATEIDFDKFNPSIKPANGKGTLKISARDQNTIYKMSYTIDETTNAITINYNP
jgi:hypothetical protein